MPIQDKTAEPISEALQTTTSEESGCEARPNEVSVSIVIPVYNEEDNVEVLHGEIGNALDNLDCTDYEILFINDGSTDDTGDVLHRLYASDPDRVRVIHFRRNFGKAAALNAGFSAAANQVVVTMDGDLQDDPAEIPRLLRMIQDGYDVVSGWKRHRRDSLEKRMASKLFNWVVGRMTGLRLHDFNCGLKAYKLDVVRELDIYGEQHRYIPVLAHALGYRVGEAAVNHRPRRSGKSKYGFERYLRGFLDLLAVALRTRFANRPGHFFGTLGVLTTGLGGVILCYLAALWFLGYRPIGDRPLLFLGGVMFLAGLQILMLGLVSELFVAARPPQDVGNVVCQYDGPDPDSGGD